jgi:hypothetical protein
LLLFSINNYAVMNGTTITIVNAMPNNPCVITRVFIYTATFIVWETNNYGQRNFD